MEDIYCENGGCPICGTKDWHQELCENFSEDSNMKKEHEFRCKNNCYLLTSFIPNGKKSYRVYVRIFDTWYHASFYNKRERIAFEKKVSKNISYWKKNDRYLLELLTKQ